MSEQDEKKMKYLTLRTTDNVEIAVEESAAILSKTIKNLVEDDCASNVIPVQVDSITMSKVIEYCKKHAGENIASEDEIKALKEFDADFVKVLDQNMLYHLLVASNYLNIDGLLDVIAQQLADMIKGKKPQEIRDLFHIRNDFTPEEEEEIREKNPWAFE